MNDQEGPSKDRWAKPAPFGELNQSLSSNNQPFTASGWQQYNQNWEDSLMLDFGGKEESPFSKFNQAFGDVSSPAGSSNDQNKSSSAEDGPKRGMLQDSKIQDWDPRAMLNDLSSLKQKIHNLQEFVHIIGGRGQVSVLGDELVAQQQQLITADLTSIIIQLISTAGSLLPSGPIGQSNGVLFPPTTSSSADMLPQSDGGPEQQNISGDKPIIQNNQLNHNCMDVHELKDEDEAFDQEHLPPGSYVILQLEKSDILVPRTYFCTICRKGFKRDANLRMHMRGHGDEYKTLAALERPHSDASELLIHKRYSCPSIGCKRNKDHSKFQPLKTLLCVKNHYKRSHCDKKYTCSKCNTKKFSVLADLKTHEKHCGIDKWICSCGTTFSRKDKLFGHIVLFQGHTPAIPLEEDKGSAFPYLAPVENGEDEVGSMAFSFGSDGSNVGGIQSTGGMNGDFFSLMDFDSCTTGGLELQEFLQSADADSETSFPFLASGTMNGLQSGSGDDES